MTLDEIRDIFFTECEESLAAAEAGLTACRNGQQDGDTVNAVFRAVHSIKGGGGAFGFAKLQAYAHAFETLLSDIRDGTLAMNDTLAELLLRALDMLSDHVMAARGEGDLPDDAALIAEMNAALASSGPVCPSSEVAADMAPDPAPDTGGDADGGADPFDLDAMLDDITGSLGPAETVSTDAEAQGWRFHLRPHAGAMRNGNDPLLLLRELAAMGGRLIACDSSAIPPLDQFDAEQGYLGWTFAMPDSASEQAVRELFDFVGEHCSLGFAGEAMPDLQLEPKPEIQATPDPVPAVPALSATAPVASAAPAPPPAQTIRIDLAKLDRLIDAVGELVIGQAMMAQRLEAQGMAASEELALLDGLTRDIQESAMAIRAQPIGSVFSRVPRILRDLAGTTGKHVRLEISGETTELDKTVVERLGEPLTHLIRNAVDHGIESAAERLAAGKSAEGTLHLSAEHRSGRILIRIADDGAGINRERVLAKAIEKGIVSADAQLSHEEIDNLIFAPGFSTAQTVSSVSGRGVGMDVVRQTVKELGGRISIESEPGQGTCFIMALPLTLAISDGMIVSVNGEAMVVPLAHVVESMRPLPGSIHNMGLGRQMLEVRGRFIPIVAVGAATGAQETGMSPEDGVLIVVDTEAAGQAALLVDAIHDQRQFVIKNLDTHYRPVEGVAGATILGDGRVALIVDVDGLVARSLADPKPEAA